MPNKFLNLPKNEQEKIIILGSQKLGRDPNVIEKDIWVCWVLEQLFSMPNRLLMAFKGGTSLSKVFNLINRFSEDVDVTLDYRSFEKDVDLFSEGISKSKLRKISDVLKNHVRDHVHLVVKPYFSALLDDLFGKNNCKIDLSDNGEKMRIYYPSVLEDIRDDYLSNSILIEFGGRNITEPNQEHVIRPYLTDVVQELEFPKAAVTVLSPARTFWEKATLMHVECNRGEYKANASRLSRHWYDLAALSRSTIGDLALGTPELLMDVIRNKKVFYDSPYANYDACLQKRFQMIPNEKFLVELKTDFEKMLESGMFYGDQPNFEDIMSEIEKLEIKVNSIDSL